MSSRQRRVVVKIGGSTLTTPQYTLRQKRLRSLAQEIANLRQRGFTPLLVSSGAVPAGYGALRLARYPVTIQERQAAAAVGQGALMHLYQQLFARHHLLVAQLLLTQDDFSIRSRYMNIRNTLDTLLQQAVIPIINENDTVSVDRTKVGDNDTLGALVATLVDAEQYIILSDIDGLYTANPRQDPAAQLIPVVEKITPAIENMAGERGSVGGTGGMRTKLKAARIATAAGVEMVIANGEQAAILEHVIDGTATMTRFLPRKIPLTSRKSWLAFSTRPSGRLVVDMGAVQALVHQHRSLLATGILSVEGDFVGGSVVEICGPDGQELGRGISQYTSAEIEWLKGKGSEEIARLTQAASEVVHRDQLALFTSAVGVVS